MFNGNNAIDLSSTGSNAYRRIHWFCSTKKTKENKKKTYLQYFYWDKNLTTATKFLMVNTWLHMGVGGLPQQSDACLGWKLVNLSTGPEHLEAQTAGEDPLKAPVVWWRKEEWYFEKCTNDISLHLYPMHLSQMKGVYIRCVDSNDTPWSNLSDLFHICSKTRKTPSSS